jgi:hypothetical protein
MKIEVFDPFLGKMVEREVTVTGRFFCGDPALQWPTKNLRPLPIKGVFQDLDYSAIELRLAANFRRA